MSLIFLFSALLFSQTTWALQRTEWSLHLDSTFNVLLFNEEAGPNTNKDLYQLELMPIYLWKYRNDWRFVSQPLVQLSPHNLSVEERIYFDPNETYVRLKNDDFSLQLGSTLFAWGITDGYNPLDIINSRQYYDPLHARKQGALSVIFSQSFNSWDYEIVYIPENQSARLPGTQSRWLPREVFIPEGTQSEFVLNLPEELRYTYSPRQNLNDALKNNFAMRLQRPGASFDTAISFFEGAANFPLVQPEVTGTVVQVSPKTIINVDTDVTLHSKNYRIRHGGLAITVTRPQFLLKYATAYTQSLGADPLLPGWTHESVLGLEKNFNLSADLLLITILQHSFINSERNSDSNFSVKEIFRRAWMLGGRLIWKDTWTFSFLGLQETLHLSHYEEISIAHRLQDHWNISLMANLISGPKDTALGVYHNNSSVSFSVSRSF